MISVATATVIVIVRTLLDRSVTNIMTEYNYLFSGQRCKIPRWRKSSSTRHGTDHKLFRKPSDER